MVALRMAPEWDITTWLNTDVPISLASLRGRPIVAAGFQMLCPGCVAETIPQLNRIHRLFPADQLAVIGLHSVFEHHEAMREPSLRAFLHEYGVRFPVGIDRHVTGDPIPTTMRTYGFQGTPTLLLIDADGRLRRQHFGHIPDLPAWRRDHGVDARRRAQIGLRSRRAGRSRPALRDRATSC